MKTKKNLKIDKRKGIFAGSLGLFAGVAFVFGFQLQVNGAVSYETISTWLLCLVTAVILAGIVYLLLSVELSFSAKGFGKLGTKMFGVLCFLFMFGCWGVQLVGVYPGFLIMMHRDSGRCMPWERLPRTIRLFIPC